MQELSEPAYAHAGMVGAAKAIFEDMQQRGVLQQVNGPHGACCDLWAVVVCVPFVR